jgi:Protein of unknown function (DUF2809).
MKKSTKRLIYLALTVLIAAIEVFIALYAHDRFVRPYGGDILVVVAVYTLVRVFLPEGCPLLPLWVFLFAVAVEVLQYCRITKLLGVADNRFLRVLLGGYFDRKDIVCYGVGCAILAAVELYFWKRRGVCEQSGPEKNGNTGI